MINSRGSRNMRSFTSWLNYHVHLRPARQRFRNTASDSRSRNSPTARDDCQQRD